MTDPMSLVVPCPSCGGHGATPYAGMIWLAPDGPNDWMAMSAATCECGRVRGVMATFCGSGHLHVTLVDEPVVLELLKSAEEIGPPRAHVVRADPGRQGPADDLDPAVWGDLWASLKAD